MVNVVPPRTDVQVRVNWSPRGWAP